MEPREFPTNLFCCSCSYCYDCSGSFTKGLQKEQEHEKEENERERSVIRASSYNPVRGDSAADGLNELRQEGSERRNTDRSKERGRFFRQTRETGGTQVSRGGETILNCRRQPKIRGRLRATPAMRRLACRSINLRLLSKMPIFSRMN